MNRKEMFKDDIEEAVEFFLKEHSEQIKLPKPFIDGKDIIFLGLNEGKGIGKVKELLYDMQLEGNLLDREGALLKAKEIIRDYYLDKQLKNT
jgi:transcriptional regulator of aromatic amino acid metabolism